MDVSEQILNLIEQVKSLPSSLPRNKALSFLQNAQIWSEKLIPQSAEEPQAECNCPIGGIRRDCPVHKSN